MAAPSVNEEQARYWNGDEGTHWLAHEGRYEAMLAPFTARLLDAAALSRTDRVLDVGCGCGSTTRAAGRATFEGDALGVDLSRQLLDRAEERTREAGLSNVRFARADAQTYEFVAPPFDVAISRFGVMFFDDPLAAFANIGRALRPDGRLVFVCWAGVLDNEWIAVPGAAAAQHMALPDGGDPGGPGPFSLADHDRILATLRAAHFDRIQIESVSEPIALGSGIAETVEFFRATGFAQALLKDADTDTVTRVADAIEEALVPYLTADGVRLGSKAWLVTARTPARRTVPQ